MQLEVYYLPYSHLEDFDVLNALVYCDASREYYWSDDFSAKYYMAQAKAGFISTARLHEGKELLLPKMAFSYALLDFKNLHISKKVKRLLIKNNLKLEISQELDEVFEGIDSHHDNNWLSERYLDMLKRTKGKDKNFKVVSILIREDKKVISGEIGYIIGKTYTSLSGFSSKEKRYQNYGTAQLVMLAKYLEENDFSFWNLGQSDMEYKIVLGAKIFERQAFLKRWRTNAYIV